MSVDGLSWSRLRALPGLEGRRKLMRERLAGTVLTLQESLGTDEHSAAVEALCSLLQWPVLVPGDDAPKSSVILVHASIVESEPVSSPGQLQLCVVHGLANELLIPRVLVDLRTAICEAMDLAWPGGLGERLARLAPRVADTPFTVMTWLGGALPVARRPEATDDEITGAGLAKLLVQLLGRVEPRVAAWVLALAVDPLFPRPGPAAQSLRRDTALELAFAEGLVEGFPASGAAGELDLRRPFRILGELNAHSLQMATQAALARSLPPELVSLLDGTSPPTSLGSRPESVKLAGRHEELERLESLCEAGEQVRTIALHGPPGFGKRALAVGLGDRIGSQRMVWLDLRPGPASAWATIAAALGLPAQIELPERRPSWLDGLFERLRPMELVLVIQGVEAVGDLSDWLPQGPGRLIVLLLSERRPLDVGEDVLDVPLFPLLEGDADRMLQDRAAALSAKERRLLLPFLEGVPGRIHLAGMALGHMEAAALGARLAEGGEQALEEAALADWSAEERFVGGLLSLVPPRLVPVGLVEGISGLGAVEGTNGLLRRGALTKHDGFLELDSSVARALSAVLATAESANLERVLAFGALDQWLLLAQQGGAAEKAMRPLLGLVVPWLERWMSPELSGAAWQKLALSSQWLSDRVHRGHTELLSSAIALSHALGEHHPDLLARTEALRQEAENRAIAPPFQFDQGLADALSCCERGLGLAGEDSSVRFALLNTLGNVHKAHGQWQPALKAYEQALELGAQPAGRAGVLSNLATVWRALPDGDLRENQRKALEYADQARRMLSDQTSVLWAQLQINWAAAIVSHQDPSAEEILEAIRACAHALVWISPLQDPSAWAVGQLNLSAALGRLHAESPQTLVERGAWACREGLEVAHPAEQPVNFAKLTIQLASCQIQLGDNHPLGGPSEARQALSGLLQLPGLPPLERQNAEGILAQCWLMSPVPTPDELDRAEAIFQRTRTETDPARQPERWAEMSYWLAFTVARRLELGEDWDLEELRRRCAEVLAWPDSGQGRHRGVRSMLARAEFLGAQRGDDAGWARGLVALIELLDDASSSTMATIREVLQSLNLWRPAPEIAELNTPVKALLDRLDGLATNTPALTELANAATFQLLKQAPLSVREEHTERLQDIASKLSAVLNPSSGLIQQRHLVLTQQPRPGG